MNITIQVRSNSDFLKTHGRKVKSLGGSYDRVNPRYASVRNVTLPRSEDGTALANELLAKYGRVWASDKYSINVRYESYKLPHYVTRQLVSRWDPKPVETAFEQAQARSHEYYTAIIEVERALSMKFYDVDRERAVPPVEAGDDRYVGRNQLT